RGDFLPPVPLPRRMWVGGSLAFRGGLLLGDAVERHSTVVSVDEKDGRSGRLVFVRVHHVITKGGLAAVEEDQDLVYRELAAPGAPRAGGEPPPADWEWRELFRTDPVVLFRFSALTFNGHRIHYDHTYAEGVEGYPGLVVHAPLTALLLLDAAVRHRPGAAPVRFTYRAEGPLFCPEVITLAGRTGTQSRTDLWALAPDGRTAMKGMVEWAT
ncbi:MAG: MaoC family dehydratase N-terminal domain-containing protein, partial [Gemmatimonadota bacterium]